MAPQTQNNLIRDLLRIVQDLARQSQAPPPPSLTQSSTSTVVNHAAMTEQFCRHKLPTFNGSSRPLAVEEWLRKLERIFQLLTSTDAQKVKSTEFMFVDDASHWWESMSRTKSESELDALTWSQFKEELMEKYFSQAPMDSKETEFLQLRQRSVTLPKYEQKFKQLSKHAPHLVDTEAKKIKRFEQRLSTNMSLILLSHSFTSYREMLARAKKIWYHKASLDQSVPQNKDFTGKRKWSGVDNIKKMARKEAEYRIQQHQARSLLSTLPKM
ncbi:Uncharacterized protein Adt_40680 [Abeliophyllum distichum]|uniref:Retrotransposon gag domain-containing protein n=1 Tax=Abeliophyllum distichum TaxID=126358 RepID=A0ABD1Q9L3_9LAMI